MGYHVILRPDEKTLHAIYVEQIEDLAEISNLTPDSIVYQGEKDWAPVKLGQSEAYKNFAEPWFRAGLKAQKLFIEEATQSGLIVEQLSQDQNTFRHYITNANIPIKRGDFLL